MYILRQKLFLTLSIATFGSLWGMLESSDPLLTKADLAPSIPAIIKSLKIWPTPKDNDNSKIFALMAFNESQEEIGYATMKTQGKQATLMNLEAHTQSQRIGSTLLKTCINIAQQEGATTMALTAIPQDPDNIHRLINFYKKYGSATVLSTISIGSWLYRAELSISIPPQKIKKKCNMLCDIL